MKDSTNNGNDKRDISQDSVVKKLQKNKIFDSDDEANNKDDDGLK